MTRHSKIDTITSLTMRYLICLLLLVASPRPMAAEINRLPNLVAHRVDKTPPEPFQRRPYFFWKKYRTLDKMAVVAICLDGVPVVATLVTYWVAGGFAAGFMLAFSSIFFLAGMVLGAISLIRAAFRGWRRGTFWAALALGLPLLGLLVIGLLA